ncbi:hypothetical protein F5884DRAFT_833561 [Xylogone sp. PMI_703]|nr:hypothetical protein F5884DRAFT_833561 [Xylogone sp. PMI_703]
MSTPSPQFALLPCSIADAKSMAELYIKAFSDAYVFQFFMPPATVSYASKEAWLINRFGKLFSQREYRITKIVDTEMGSMVAFMTWAAPFVMTEEEKKERAKAEKASKAQYKTPEEARAAKYPEGTNLDCADAIFTGFDGIKEKWYKESEHYIIHMLVTDPAYQKKGLGTHLLGQVLDLADTEAKVTYLEAMEAGHGLYLKLGWVDVDFWAVDVSKWGGGREAPYWAMLRQPQKAN